jgi:hypothetical protein
MRIVKRCMPKGDPKEAQCFHQFMLKIKETQRKALEGNGVKFEVLQNRKNFLKRSNTARFITSDTARCCSREMAPLGSSQAMPPCLKNHMKI